MEKVIDLGKNIQDSLVTEQLTSTNKDVKLGDYLLMGGFNADLLNSLPEEVAESTAATESAINVSNNCVKFDFKIFDDIKIDGKICLDGTADVSLNAYGVEVKAVDAKLDSNGICNTTKVSGFLTVKLCFKLQNNCLYVSGNLSTPFGELGSWNERIVCL